MMTSDFRSEVEIRRFVLAQCILPLL